LRETAEDDAPALRIGGSACSLAAQGTGIDGEGAGNVLERNTALANEDLDMEDDAACDDRWRRNVLGSGTPAGFVR